MTTPTHVQRSAVPLSTHDTTRIDDLRIKAVRPLITPAPVSYTHLTLPTILLV